MATNRKITRGMQKKYRRRRITLLVVLFVVVAGVTVGLIGGVGWLLSDREGASAAEPSAPEDTPENPATLGAAVAGTGTTGGSERESVSEPEPEPLVSDDDAWRLILASASNSLPDGYAPPELETITENYQVDSRIAPELRRMISDAKLEGITLMICSAYRDQDYQQTLFDKQVDQWRSYTDSEEEAAAEAVRWVLLPGTSEHQTGLAVDIVTPEYQTLDDGFAETPAARWMAENSWKYGFVLRYPRDKQDITKVTFEPWHFRYVGTEHAQVIYEKGYCLEEYLYIELRQQISGTDAVQVQVADLTGEDVEGETGEDSGEDVDS